MKYLSRKILIGPSIHLELAADGNGYDGCSSITLDTRGGILVTGDSYNTSTSSDMVILRYIQKAREWMAFSSAHTDLRYKEIEQSGTFFI